MPARQNLAELAAVHFVACLEEEHELREWVTGLAHRNGTVDVVFDAAISDSARFQGARAEFNPKMETCSAISRHSNDGLNRFGWT